MYAAHSGLYTLAGRPVTQIVFTYLAYIHRCRAYRYTTLLHRCRRVILERFFFSNSSPPSQHTASRPKAYTGITTTATGVIRRSWFSVSAYICTYANITQIVYTLVPAIIYLTYCYELLVVRPSTNADEINLLLSTY